MEELKELTDKQIVAHIRWLRNHARVRKCPPCAGLKRPNREEDSLHKGVMFCMRCNRVWLYRVMIELEVRKRKPMWRYAKYQYGNIFKDY